MMAEGKYCLRKMFFIGSNAIVLRNVTIGENSIVASGAVITVDVPDNCIVAGNHTRIVKNIMPINK
jgi:acetyltransferase-like isoleucine patch superfamily enzyme